MGESGRDGWKVADTMTDKEMHKLSRRELLQLLLAQVSETEELKQSVNEKDSKLAELHENYERLRKRLDQKDAKIHELQNILHEERTTRRIELQEAGSIAEASLRLNGIFEVAQKAADQYLENIKMLNDRLVDGEDIFPEPVEYEDIEELGGEEAIREKEATGEQEEPGPGTEMGDTAGIHESEAAQPEDGYDIDIGDDFDQEWPEGSTQDQAGNWLDRQVSRDSVG